jgi:squalene-hopene/tetraprenyl-beta-curcumene cyclase
MANLVMAYAALGRDPAEPEVATARTAIEKLVIEKSDEAYVQPCLSPVWDTALASHALLEAGEEGDGPVIGGALKWLADRQILEETGDWAVKRPDVRPGGWAFQYRNDPYPDVDDTAAVAYAMERADPQRWRTNIDRAVEWVEGIQSKNGGWGAFDVDNTHYELNHIPFADHGALLDPPEVDVSARCVSMFMGAGRPADHPTVKKALDYIKAEQEADGSWFGRWGANYIYGTWSALHALNAAGEPHDSPVMRRAVDFLVSKQRSDGGWGEDLATYEVDSGWVAKESNPSQTAWALLGLMAAGEVHHPAVERGVRFLVNAPREGARWEERYYTGTGFPRVFYLKYHGYPAFFPIWALARYARLRPRNDARVEHAI